MHVFITKYALTSGIFEAEAEVTEISPTMISTEAYDCYYHKPHWHTTREEAMIQAEKMRKARIAALHRQLKKLKALKFTAK